MVSGDEGGMPVQRQLSATIDRAFRELFEHDVFAMITAGAGFPIDTICTTDTVQVRHCQIRRLFSLMEVEGSP